MPAQKKSKEKDFLAEVMFRESVQLIPGATKKIWNPSTCLRTQMVLDGRELQLLDADGNVIRYIPYHMVSSFTRDG